MLAPQLSEENKLDKHAEKRGSGHARAHMFESLQCGQQASQRAMVSLASFPFSWVSHSRFSVHPAARQIFFSQWIFVRYYFSIRDSLISLTCWGVVFQKLQGTLEMANTSPGSRLATTHQLGWCGDLYTDCQEPASRISFFLCPP